MSRCVALAILVAGQAVGQSAEPTTIFLAPIVPPSIRLLSQSSVRDDVGLSSRQKEAIDSLQAAWAVPTHVWVAAPLVWVTPEIARAVIDQRSQDFLTKELTAAQRKRLDQVVFQLKEREFGAHAAFAMAAGDLGLQADQKDDVRTLKNLRVEEIAKHVTSGERFAKVKDKVETTNGDTFEKMTEMLSRAQRERLKELKGKAFGGKLEKPPVPLALPMPRLVPQMLQYSASQNGLYDLELLYCNHPAIKTELKLTDSQAKAISNACDQAADGMVDGRVRRGWIDSIHALTEKTLNEHLKPEQRVRFEQIMLQRRSKVSPAAIYSHPAAIAALKLSPIQIEQISTGKGLADVMTKAQLVKSEQLLGKPFDLPSISDDYLAVAVRVPVRRGIQVPQVPQVPQESPVVAHAFLQLTGLIGLNADQIKKLRELSEDEPKIMELIQKELDFSDTPPVIGAGRSLTAVGAVTDHFKAAVEEQCWNVLDPAQQSLARKIFGRGK